MIDAAGVSPRERRLRRTALSQMTEQFETPAFVYDVAAVQFALRGLQNVKSAAACKVLFALKSFCLAPALQRMVGLVDGFATSSPFEALMARRLLGTRGTVHLTTPGLRPSDARTVGHVSDYLAFNSLSQWHRLRHAIDERVKLGLRLNPQLSVVRDVRYDPCRPFSRLGVPLHRVRDLWKESPEALSSITGFLLHTNCDSSTFAPLLQTVQLLDDRLAPVLEHMEWVNLGGGYLFDEGAPLDDFYEAVTLLRSKHGVEVFIEPGASVVRRAASLVASVIDLFESDGRAVAVLDTTVNHMPEVFEYQFEPDVEQHHEGGTYRYILGGSTCLAGDVFGEYAFTEPLQVGSRIVFPNAGAYTLVKAHMFNGVNLPTIYALTERGELVMKKRFTFDDFEARCGVSSRVPD